MHRLVTITGDLGSGKSTVAKLLANRWRCQRYSTGDAQRQIAQSRNITTLELNKLAEVDSSIDKEIDSVFEKLKDAKNDLVVDSRMAWFFLPQSLKIKLTVLDQEAAERVFNDKTRTSETLTSLGEVFNNLQSRRQSEVIRFKNYYHVDIDDDSNFDVVIDATQANPEQIVELIDSLSQGFYFSGHVHKYWASPKSLLPTASMDELTHEQDWQPRANTGTGEKNYNQDESVKIVKDKRNGFFIFEGHRRTSHALFAGRIFIPIDIMDKRELPYQGTSEARSFISAWEAAHGFKFKHHPDQERD